MHDVKRIFGWLLAGLLTHSASAAPISVVDDHGQTVQLAQPAQRVISLAPHVTELIFAAGGGGKLVGTVTASDFPAEAKRLPKIGDSRQLDLERIIALKPDLLVVWLHGNAERQLEPLRRLGIPLFYSEPKTLAAIPDSLTRLGLLLGSAPRAQQAAQAYRQRWQQLAQRYQQRPPLRVFYQVWNKPLYTLNGQHIVSDVIRLCGGVNIFSGLPVTAPTVTQEAVLAENPQVIIAGDMAGRASAGLAMWRAFPSLEAVRRGHLFTVDADILHRPGPRILDGAAALCAQLDRARAP